MMARLGSGTGNPNVAFYRAHQAQIDRMMDLGSGAGAAAGSDEDLSALNVKKFGECTKLALVALPALDGWRMTGTIGGAPPDEQIVKGREASAKALADLAPKLGEQNLQDDFHDISDEIRRQAAAAQFTPTPRFTRAYDDLNNWLQSNCSKEALKK